MTLAEQLRGIGDLPFEEALPKQVEILRGSELRVPVEVGPDDSETHSTFILGKDAQGKSWLYAYTSEEGMIKAGLTGTKCAHFRFEDVVGIGHRNQFGGIVIDMHDPTAAVHIPDYCLESLNAYLND